MAKFSFSFLRNRKLDQALEEIAALKAQTAKYPAWALAMAQYEKWTMPDPSIYANQADLYRRLSWVNIAVNIGASSCAAQAGRVKQIKGEEEEDIVNHPFELRLINPNPMQSRFELLNDTFANYALVKNAYWWLNRANEDAEPDEIWIIPPDHIMPIPDERMYLKGYAYFPGGPGTTPIPLETWEVVHFHGFNPHSTFIGMSDVEPIALVAQGDMGMQAVNAKIYLESQGRLPGILAFADTYNPTDWEALQDSVRDKANKKQIMMLQGIKSGAVQWIQAAAALKDMEFNLGRKANKEEIFDEFAPGLLSMLSENATEANAKTGKATFAEYYLYPRLTLFGEKITSAILPAYGENIRFEFDDPRPLDRQLELSEMMEYSKTHTVDEVRKKYWGDAPVAEVTENPDDPRGELFPIQIGPTTPTGEDTLGEEEPETQPLPLSAVVTTDNIPKAPTQNETDANAAETDKGVPAELKRWERKALKAVAKGESAAVKFTSDVIPIVLHNDVSTGLESCETAEAIKAVFDRAVSGVSSPVADYAIIPQDAASVLEGIRLAVEAMKIERIA